MIRYLMYSFLLPIRQLYATPHPNNTWNGINMYTASIPRYSGRSSKQIDSATYIMYTDNIAVYIWEFGTFADALHSYSELITKNYVKYSYTLLIDPWKQVIATIERSIGNQVVYGIKNLV